MTAHIGDRLRQALRDEARAYRGPTLLFDLVRIRERMERLAELEQRHHCRFLMAAKAFRAAPVQQLAARLLSGFDVSNANEYAELPANLSGKRVSLANPVLHGQDVPRLRSKGNALVVVLDSLSQRAQLENVDQATDFAIRLSTTGFVEPSAWSRPPPRKQSRFGLAAADLEGLRSLLGLSGHRFVGFHVHHGYGGNAAETFVRLARECVALAESLAVRLAWLDLGGGLHRIPEPQLGSMLADVRREVPESSELVFEPGELLSLDCGVALARVETGKPQSDALVCTLDLSATWHLHWSRPVLVPIEGAAAARQVTVAFYGPTCSEHDFFGEFAVPAGERGDPLRSGDFVGFAGVSGYSVSCNDGFNGVPPARVVFVE